MKYRKAFQEGQSIVEVIISISIFIIIASGAITAIISSFTSSRLSKEESQAALLASEGIEAVKSIRNNNWINLTNGDHGISSSSGMWAFSGASDVYNKYTRKINISDVYRNNGEIASTGTLDPDTKKITATITWSFSPTRNNTVTLVEYLTNWQTGKFKGPSPEANLLTVDLTRLSLGPAKKSMQGITLGNRFPGGPITILTIKLTWKASTTSEANRITINGNAVWTGTAASGTTIDITDTVIPANSNNIPLEIAFTKNISGATFEIVFNMSDGSIKTIQGVNPN